MSKKQAWGSETKGERWVLRAACVQEAGPSAICITECQCASVGATSLNARHQNNTVLMHALSTAFENNKHSLQQYRLLWRCWNDGSVLWQRGARPPLEVRPAEVVGADRCGDRAGSGGAATPP